MISNIKQILLVMDYTFSTSYFLQILVENFENVRISQF